jgi:putative flippase GtrA
MKHYVANFNIRRWLRFVTGGGINTLFTYGIYLVINMMLGYQVAYLISYFIGIIFAYWFNSVVVFRERLSWKVFFSYPLIYVVQYAVSALLLGSLVEIANVSEKFAPLMVAAGMVPITYIMNNLIFRWMNYPGKLMNDTYEKTN